MCLLVPLTILYHVFAACHFDHLLPFQYHIPIKSFLLYQMFIPLHMCSFSGHGTGSAAGHTGIMVAKPTEFSYQELAKVTNNFSLDNKIGQGGLKAVYYAELRGAFASISLVLKYAAHDSVLSRSQIYVFLLT